MAGQHIERQARYEETGMTSVTRDQLILRLRRKGWTIQRIANHVGLTTPAVHYALKRLTGVKRNRAPAVEMREGCWDDVPAGGLNRDGLCAVCVSGG